MLIPMMVKGAFAIQAVAGVPAGCIYANHVLAFGNRY